MESKFATNSLDYWNERFSSSDWLEHLGEEQSKFFMQLLISHLPRTIKSNIFFNSLSILDFGTALGQGCEELYNEFPTSEITGLDFSESAIEQAREIYRELDIEFRSEPLVADVDKFDVICTSNTLEHLSDWLEYLHLFSKVAQKYIIILVPFKSGVFDEHVVEFNLDSFPDGINGFTKVFSKVIQCDEPKYWDQKQLLVAYSKS